VEKSTGKPVSFTSAPPTRPAAERAQQYLQQAWQDVGFVVKDTIVEQNDLINNALAGKFQALEWRQFGAVDPDLNYIFWSTTTIQLGLPVHQHGPQRRPAASGRPGTGARQHRPGARAKAYQTVNKRLALDLPYLWLDRAVWSVESTLKVQNWNNPTTPAGLAGLRHDRRLHLADADLAELS
jgi:ABC-type transport system substrate-binding protein